MRVIKYIRNVARRRRRDKDMVESIEKDRSTKYRKEKNDAQLAKIAELDLA